MDPRRAQRVSGALKEELAEIIAYEMSDPRLAQVTVAGVQVSPDFHNARVRVLCGGPERQQHEALQALEGARRYLRREVAARLSLYRVPELHFELETPSGENRVEQLLRRLEEDRKKSEESPGNKQ